MARNKGTLTNIDNSNPGLYPFGRLRDNTGAGDGTPVNEFVYGDIHEFFGRVMGRYGFTFNGLPDNTANGYQLVNAVAALPTKNDHIISIGEVNATTLNVNLRIGALEENECAICQTSVSFAGRTQIRGLDNVSKAITVTGEAAANEYILLINTASSVLLIRQVDFSNFDTIATAFNYLKAATQTQENTGTANNVATTPLTNLTAFVRRVNGADSGNYLADATRNGLLTPAHFTLLQNITATTPRNIGFVSPIDARTSGGPTVGTPLTAGGNITAATYGLVVPGGRLIRCTLQTAMDDTNYYVRFSIEDSQLNSFNTAYTVPQFRAISETQFDILINQTTANPLNGRFHVEVIQRS